MAVELSSDERARIDSNRRTPRPQYYSASLLRDEMISEDFESFLILQDPATIKSSLDWLGSAGKIAEKRADRNAVAFEALVADTEDREAVQSEVGDLTAEFGKWRESFQAGKFSDTAEVGLIIKDMMATAEELFVLEERMKHLENVQIRVADVIRSDISNAQLRELQSWPTPLLAY